MEKIQKVNGITIYSLDYLINEELTDEDISNLLDRKSLTYSIIINMFRYIGLKKSNKDIIKLITTKDRWMDDYVWSKEEFNSFENLLIQALKNIYSYSDIIAKVKAQWYRILYAFRQKGNTIIL